MHIAYTPLFLSGYVEVAFTRFIGIAPAKPPTVTLSEELSFVRPFATHPRLRVLSTPDAFPVEWRGLGALSSFGHEKLACARIVSTHRVLKRLFVLLRCILLHFRGCLHAFAKAQLAFVHCLCTHADYGDRRVRPRNTSAHGARIGRSHAAGARLVSRF